MSPIEYPMNIHSHLILIIVTCVSFNCFAKNQICEVEHQYSLSEMRDLLDQEVRSGSHKFQRPNRSDKRISICAYGPDKKLESCSHHEINKVAFDRNTNRIKFYDFSSQFDLQILDSGRFIMNYGGVVNLIRTCTCRDE